MKSFKEVAKEATRGLSDLFEGREQLDADKRDELLNTDLTMMDFDVIDYDDPSDKTQPHKHYGVVVFSEHDGIAYSTGKQITEMIDAYVGEFAGDVRAARDAYAKEDKLVINMEKKRTKGGRTFVSVTVVN